MCFSVVAPDSYDNIKAKWHPEITHYCPDTPFLLVGTKIDLRDDETEVGNLAKEGKSPIPIDMVHTITHLTLGCRFK